MSEEHTHHPNYVKIWAVLVVLLAISVTGPMFEVQWLTLVTAFGIALVKAYLVIVNFMHIGAAKRFVPYLIVVSLLFMLLLFAGVAPDVMKENGKNWEKPNWAQAATDEADGEHQHH